MTQNDKVKRGRPRKMAPGNWTSELIQKKAREYFVKCDSHIAEVQNKDGDVVDKADPLPYTIEGICTFIGISREKWAEWSELPDDIGAKIRELTVMIMSNWVEGGLKNNYNANFCQFLLKNNMPRWYQDKQETDFNVAGAAGSIFAGLAESWAKNLKQH